MSKLIKKHHLKKIKPKLNVKKHKTKDQIRKIKRNPFFQPVQKEKKTLFLVDVNEAGYYHSIKDFAQYWKPWRKCVGLDIGRSWIGVSTNIRSRYQAEPRNVFRLRDSNRAGDKRDFLAELKSLVVRENVQCIFVGIPSNAAGKMNIMRQIKNLHLEDLQLPFVFVNESNTTVLASNYTKWIANPQRLNSKHKRELEEKDPKSRNVDAFAATMILQRGLDAMFDFDARKTLGDEL